jgi:hypothetical protein
MAADIKKELAGIDLGDERRNRRILKIAADMAKAPGESLRASCGGWSESMGAYRLLNSAEVTPGKIFAPHRRATLERARTCRSLLFIDDTTELDYSSHKALAGVGRLDHGHRRGFYAHNHLLVDEDSGVPLGLYGSKTWSRELEPKGGTHKKNPFEKKESHRWFEGYLQACSLAVEKPSRQVLYVADREGDIYDIHAEFARRSAAAEPAADLLIRAGRDRALSEGGELLFEHVRSAPQLGSFELKVTAKTQLKKKNIDGKKGSSRLVKRTPRTATLEVRAIRVTFRPPHRAHGGKLPELTLNVIAVREKDPPADQDPIEWILLTTLPINTFEQALRVIEAYSKRWLIEELHRVLKSGCRVEQIQLRHGDALLCALALYFIVAWRILYLRDSCRSAPELPCTLFFSEAEWRAVFIIRGKTIGASPPSLGEVMGLLGKIGGHIGRKNDPPPGPECLWKGLVKLRHYVEMGQALGAL